jgi:branched-chain amino acid transport system substrate-binding protein
MKRLVLGLLAAGLMSGGNVAVAAEPDLLFAAPASLTGPYAFIGVAMNRGVTVAVEQINAAGGIKGRKISLVVEDTGSEKAQAVTIITKAILREDVLASIGPATTIEMYAVGPLANEKQFPIITATGNPTIREFGKWTFNTAIPPEVQLKALSESSAEYLKIKKVVTVVTRENEGFVGGVPFILNYWKPYNIEIVSQEQVGQTETDFTALGTRLATLDFDTLELNMPPEQAANVVVQAKQAGMSDKVRIVVPPGIVAEGYLKTGGKAVEGTFGVADYIYSGGDPALNKRFVDDFQKKYGRVPDNWAGVGYTSMMAVAEAVRKGPDKVTRESIRDSLENNVKNIPTVMGDGKPFSIGPNRTPDYGVVKLVVKNGAFVEVK